MLKLAIEAEGQRSVLLVLLIWVGGERGVTLELVIYAVEYLLSHDLYPRGCSSHISREHEMLPQLVAESCKPSVLFMYSHGVLTSA